MQIRSAEKLFHVKQKQFGLVSNLQTFKIFDYKQTQFRALFNGSIR